MNNDNTAHTPIYNLRQSHLEWPGKELQRQSCNEISEVSSYIASFTRMNAFIMN